MRKALKLNRLVFALTQKEKEQLQKVNLAMQRDTAAAHMGITPTVKDTIHLPVLIISMFRAREMSQMITDFTVTLSVTVKISP